MRLIGAKVMNIFQQQRRKNIIILRAVIGSIRFILFCNEGCDKVHYESEYDKL